MKGPSHREMFQALTSGLSRRRLGVHGVVLDWMDGPLLSHRWRADERENIYSGAKTFTSLAAGLAREEGLLDLDTTVLEVFPHLVDVAAPGVEAVSLRHLLTMTSGNRYTMFTTAEKSVDDILTSFLTAPLHDPPGTRFEYSSGSSYVVGRMVQARTGRSLRDYLVDRLFTPLGIWNPTWGSCPRGHTWGGSDLHLTTEEYSRLGRLLLRQGEWGGRQVVARDWVRAMYEDAVDSSTWTEDPEGPRYGLGVWHCSVPGSYRADGRYGQYSVVLPPHGLSITITAHREGRANDILEAVWDELLPLLGG